MTGFQTHLRIGDDRCAVKRHHRSPILESRILCASSPRALAEFEIARLDQFQKTARSAIETCFSPICRTLPLPGLQMRTFRRSERDDVVHLDQELFSRDDGVAELKSGII